MSGSNHEGGAQRPRRIDIRGASGEHYSFAELDMDAGLRRVGVTYVIAQRTGVDWTVLDVGETSDLSAGDWRMPLSQARVTHPKAQCLVRLNVNRRDRTREVADIALLKPSRHG